MNLSRTLAASVLMLSAVGCCCMDQCGSNCCGPSDGCSSMGLFQPYCDGCDPDGYVNGIDMMDSGCSCGRCGRGSRKHRRSRMVSQRGGYMAANCCEPICCDTCGNGAEWVQGSMVSSGGGCGCGQTAHSANLPDSSNAPNASPTPAFVPPAAIPPANPPSNPNPEAENASPGDASRQSRVLQPQMVSYEEFQRLPGTVVSGPGIPPVPTSDNYSAPPANMSSVPRMVNVPSKMTVRPAGLLPPSNFASPAQQAAWVPAR